MKLAYDQSLFTEQFLLGWYEKTIKTDKNSALYNRKYESTMRKACEQFFEWLKTADEGSSDSDSSSSDDGEESKQQKEKDSGLTEAQKAQKELIKKAQEQQAKQLQEKQEQA
jgi:hypothetical protein